MVGSIKIRRFEFYSSSVATRQSHASMALLLLLHRFSPGQCSNKFGIVHLAERKCYKNLFFSFPTECIFGKDRFFFTSARSESS